MIPSPKSLIITGCKLKPEETRAAEYLRSLNIGAVVFEPRGNVAPDFEIGNGIAVEVRRLNQSYNRGGKLRGLEEDHIPLIAKIQKLLEIFTLPNDVEFAHSWFFCISIRQRPIEPWKALSKLLNQFLREECLSEIPIQEIELAPNISVSVIPSEKKLETLFRLGGSSDYDAGGWITPELRQNINHCIRAKSAVLNSLTDYQEKWLLLVDHIGFGHREEFSIQRSDWDKLILVSPHGKLTAYEPSVSPKF